MNVTWHMRTIKYPAAREVIDLLANEGIDVRHLDGLALDSWRPAGFHSYFNCLDLLLRESDYPRFHDVMQQHCYRMMLDRPGLHYAEPVAPYIHPPAPGDPASPSSPGPAYARQVQYPPELWVRFHTTWRHGVLLLADLAEWFDDPETDSVMDNSKDIKRPPLWAMILWHAGQVTGAAAECSITRENGLGLYAMIKQPGPGGLDWRDLLDRAIAYDSQYRTRVALPPVDGWITNYATIDGELNGEVYEAERSYGALYDLRHALEAVTAFDSEAVPAWVLDEVSGTGTGTARRKLFSYTGVDKGDQVAPPGSVGCLGLARADFTIVEQIRVFERDPNTTWAELTQGAHPRVQEIRTEAPPHGPWHDCTEADLAAIFA